VQIELGREEYNKIRAIVGEQVYVNPFKARVFMND
jgi:hypothetical protein